ncbi:hypothetical protein BDN72DRAFT_205588 [Pluteus cervinus]|uniref:Uncharacterized protein n=1 Tax=Pluteus cervinus TaxID=181527 RepID=A0ACD2ZWB6_9AGAR|nr:hypothetical protein BDN72DRAFT_205588 [Pluteus cervinus]
MRFRFSRLTSPLKSTDPEEGLVRGQVMTVVLGALHCCPFVPRFESRTEQTSRRICSSFTFVIWGRSGDAGHFSRLFRIMPPPPLSHALGHRSHLHIFYPLCFLFFQPGLVLKELEPVFVDNSLTKVSFLLYAVHDSSYSASRFNQTSLVKAF